MHNFDSVSGIQKKNGDLNTILNEEASTWCIILHCITFILGAIFGFVIMLRYVHHKVGLIIGFGVAFVVAWIIYMLVFFFSPEYEIVKNFNYDFPLLNSEEEFESTLWKQWLSLNPYINLTINSVDSNNGCQSQAFQCQATSSSDSDSKLPDFSLTSKLLKKAMVLVDINVDIQWTAESNDTITQLKDKMLSCPVTSSMTSKFIELSSLPNIRSVYVLTKNGLRPSKFSKSRVIAQGIFLGWRCSRL